MSLIEVVNFIRHRKRLDRPDMCPSEIYSLWQDCWSQKPEKRPTFSQILIRIDEFIREVEKQAAKRKPIDHSYCNFNSNESENIFLDASKLV